MTSLRSELKSLVLHTCESDNDEVYRRWKKFCAAPTDDDCPQALQVPLTAMRVRVMISGVTDKDECWAGVAANWEDQETTAGEFQTALETLK